MDLRDITEILLAAGVGGVLVETIRTYRQRKKLGADYADVIASSAIKLLQPLEERILLLESELLETKRRLAATEAELRIVRQDNRTLARKLIAFRRPEEG